MSTTSAQQPESNFCITRRGLIAGAVATAGLAKAAKDRSVTSVMVSFHHPLADLTGAAASQLSDQLEAVMIKNWLTSFRETSGKPIARSPDTPTWRRSVATTGCWR